MKAIKTFSSVAALILLGSGQSVFAGSCEVLQSRTVTIAENNQTGATPTASAGIGGTFDLAPLTSSDILPSNPVEMYLEGVQLDPQVNGIASLDDINWYSQSLIEFGSASTKNFRLVFNFKDGSSVECDGDIEVRYDDADPIVQPVRYEISETASGFDVEVWASVVDTDGAELVDLEYELVEGPNITLPNVSEDYDSSLPGNKNIQGQVISFSEPGSYSLRVRATDENGNTNVSLETADFDIDGSCLNASNADHIAAGRAYNFFGLAYAQGSNQWIGYAAAFDSTVLQQTIPGWWFPVLVCP